MNASLLPATPSLGSALRLLLATTAALLLLTGCPTTPRSSKLEKPTLNVLEIPSPSGSGWSTYSTSGHAPEVLPTRGRAVRVWFHAPIGSTFDVSLRALDGTVTTLPRNNGAPRPSEDGYFEVIGVNPSPNPPLYHVHVRPPLDLPDPANFDVLIVNKSLRNDVADSDPLVIPLRQRKVFTVTVQVEGNGHISSDPEGIFCGTTASGRPLTQCSHEFGSGQIRLTAASNNANTTRFRRWSGNCDPNVQVCVLTLDGTRPLAAKAFFEPRANAVPVSACPPAPTLPGLRWIDLPSCGPKIGRNPTMTPTAICDANGYYCCETAAGSNSPRCGGDDRKESLAHCMHLEGRGILRQPGGCYEVDPGP